MTCSGVSGSPGALQLKNLTDLIMSCQDNINTSCHPSNLPQPNKTKLDNCKAKG